MRSRNGVRGVLAGGLLALSFVAVSADPGSGRAYADAVSIPPVYAGIPDSLAGAAAVAEAEGIVTAAGAAGGVADGLAVGAAGVGVVAASPVVVVAAAALIVGGAIYLGWKWKSGHSATYADVPTGTVQNYPGGWAVAWQPIGTSGGCCYSADVTGPTGQAYTLGAATSTGWRGASSTQTATGSAQHVTANLGSANGTLAGECVYVPSLGANVASEGTANCGGFNFVDATSTSTTGTVVPGTAPVTTTPTSTCSNGSTTTTVAGTAIHYTGGTAAADLPPIIAPACPAGYLRTGLTTPSTGPGGALPQLVTWTAPTIPSTYSECQAGGAQAPCVLTLTKTAPGGATSNCTNTTACPLYTGVTPDAEGDSYTCKWGTYLVPVSDCKDVPTKQAAGTSTPPQTDIKAAGTGTSTDNGGDGCSGGFFGAFSWNPVDWVLKPVKCALRWAFVPSSTTSTKLQALATEAQTKAPISYFTEIGGYIGGVLAGTGSTASACLVWDVHLGMLGTFHILNSCDDAEPVVHAIKQLHGLLVVAELLAFLGPLAWWAWKSYAPLSRPQG